MGAYLRGANEAVAKLKAMAAKFPDVVAASLYKRAQIIMTESKRRCPVASDGGQLRASGRVALPVRDGRKISVQMSYGPMAYAIAVHETPSEHDPPSWQVMYENGEMIEWTSAGTGPKFLEGPINEAMPTLAKDIADDVHLKEMT